MVSSVTSLLVSDPPENQIREIFPKQSIRLRGTQATELRRLSSRNRELWGSSIHSPSIPSNLEVQPIKRGEQRDLLLVAVFEKLTGHPSAPEHSCGLVKLQGHTAVVNGNFPKILQHIRIVNHAEFVLVPVLIDDQVVHRNHLLHRLPDARDTQGIAAVQIALVDRDMIGLLPCLHERPGRSPLLLTTLESRKQFRTGTLDLEKRDVW